MTRKRNYWKVVQGFVAAIVATIFSAGSSKATPVQTKAISEQTIEERLAQVRSQLKHREEQIAIEFHIRSSPPDPSETEEHKTLLSRWSNWTNWYNY